MQHCLIRYVFLRMQHCLTRPACFPMDATLFNQICLPFTFSVHMRSTSGLFSYGCNSFQLDLPPFKNLLCTWNQPVVSFYHSYISPYLKIFSHPTSVYSDIVILIMNHASILLLTLIKNNMGFLFFKIFEANPICLLFLSLWNVFHLHGNLHCWRRVNDQYSWPLIKHLGLR